MGKSWISTLQDLLSRSRKSPGLQNYQPRNGGALAESTKTLDRIDDQGLIQTAQQAVALASPFADVQACSGLTTELAGQSSFRPASSRPSALHPESAAAPKGSAYEGLSTRPSQPAAVRFAEDVADGTPTPERAASEAPSLSVLQSIMNAGGSRRRGGPGVLEGKTSRVRLLAPESSGSSGRSGLERAEGSMRDSTVAMRSDSVTSNKGKAEGQSRALAQLVSRLIAHDVDYRAEMQALMATSSNGCFSRGQLQEVLDRRSIALPPGRLAMIANIYRAGPEGDQIDGLNLLRDMEKAAFRCLAVADGGGSGLLSAAPEAGGGGPSRKNLAPHGELGDMSRILTLVSAQLEQDTSLRIMAASGEQLAPEHIQEVVQSMDLTTVALPVGTRARYVPATDEPGSFQVPVWSLRAMHKRKQERDHALMGNGGSELKQLGQAGRDALRKRITRRSIFQQQEIIAHAVVAAARCAVVPSLRHIEHSVQASVLPGTLNMQPTFTSVLGAGRDAEPGTLTPARSGVDCADGSQPGVRTDPSEVASCGGNAEAYSAGDSGAPASQPCLSQPPNRADSSASMLHSGSSVCLEGPMAVPVMAVVMSPEGLGVSDPGQGNQLPAASARPLSPLPPPAASEDTAAAGEVLLPGSAMWTGMPDIVGVRRASPAAGCPASKPDLWKPGAEELTVVGVSRPNAAKAQPTGWTADKLHGTSAIRLPYKSEAGGAGSLPLETQSGRNLNKTYSVPSAHPVPARPLGTACETPIGLVTSFSAQLPASLTVPLRPHTSWAAPPTTSKKLLANAAGAKLMDVIHEDSGSSVQDRSNTTGKRS